MANTINTELQRQRNTIQQQWHRILLAGKVCSNLRNTKQERSEGSYSEICQQRYQAAFERYNRQFLKEIQHLEQMQSCAIKAMAIHRAFSLTSLWPPLHTKREIDSTTQYLERNLTSQQKRRLQHILKYGPNIKQS